MLIGDFPHLFFHQEVFQPTSEPVWLKIREPGWMKTLDQYCPKIDRRTAGARGRCEPRVVSTNVFRDGDCEITLTTVSAIGRASPVNVPAEEIGYGLFLCSAFGHGDDYLHQLVFACIDLDVVEFEENQCASRAGPLVPVYEGVVPGDVEKIGRGHLEQVVVQKPSPEARRGHGECRLQKTEVPNTGLTTVAFDLVAVDTQHLAEIQENGGHGLFREALEGTTVFSVHLFQGFLELLLVLGITDRRYDQDLPVRRDFEGRVRVDLQQLQYRPVDDERQAIPVFCQALDHDNISSIGVLCKYNVSPWAVVVDLNIRGATWNGNAVPKERWVPGAAGLSRPLEGLFKGFLHQVRMPCYS